MTTQEKMIMWNVMHATLSVMTNIYGSPWNMEDYKVKELWYEMNEYCVGLGKELNDEADSE